jgi:hypothetical protein
LERFIPSHENGSLRSTDHVVLSKVQEASFDNSRVIPRGKTEPLYANRLEKHEIRTPLRDRFSWPSDTRMTR